LNSIVRQVNGLLFLLVAMAILAVENDRPFFSGVLLAIASLFKLFPIIIAIILGIRNWRILAGCLAAIIISLLIPGSLKWLSLLSTVNPIDIPINFYTAAYQWLGSYSLLLFAFFSGSIGIITVLVAFSELRLPSLDIIRHIGRIHQCRWWNTTTSRLILPIFIYLLLRDIQGWLTRPFDFDSYHFNSSMSGPSGCHQIFMLFLFGFTTFSRYPSRTFRITFQMKHVFE
jgi:hypothetical protein